MEEIDSMEEIRERSMHTKKHLSTIYECAFPISDVARDLRIICYEFKFTMIHFQLPIIIGMFLEFVIIDFLKELEKIKQEQSTNKRTIFLDDIKICKERFFPLFDEIVIDEDVYTQCMFSVPIAKTPVNFVEKINSFPIPQLKKRRNVPKFIS